MTSATTAEPPTKAPRVAKGQPDGGAITVAAPTAPVRAEFVGVYAEVFALLSRDPKDLTDLEQVVFAHRAKALLPDCWFTIQVRPPGENAKPVVFPTRKAAEKYVASVGGELLTTLRKVGWSMIAGALGVRYATVSLDVSDLPDPKTGWPQTVRAVARVRVTLANGRGSESTAACGRGERGRLAAPDNTIVGMAETRAACRAVCLPLGLGSAAEEFEDTAHDPPAVDPVAAPRARAEPSAAGGPPAGSAAAPSSPPPMRAPSDKPVPTVPEAEITVRNRLVARLHAAGKERGLDHIGLRDIAKAKYEAASSKDLTLAELEEFVRHVESIPRKEK